MNKLPTFLAAGALLLFASWGWSQEATNYWTGAANSNWFDAGNWTASHVPLAGEHVVISNQGYGVLLTNATANLASLLITNKMLTFSNWTTRIIATNVVIQSNGVLTALGPFTTGALLSNRVWITCVDLTVEAGAQINVDAKGYVWDAGPGMGTGNAYGGGGGGYGGKGGRGYYMQRADPGGTYGSTNLPEHPGSGGGSSFWDGNYYGGAGGGAALIAAAGSMTLNGTISANGGNGLTGPNGSGAGGSGGSICISCTTFGGGTTGILRANGGNAGAGPYFAGGGGGGRIAVSYSSVGATGLRFAAAPGTGGTFADWFWRDPAKQGSLYLSDASFLSANLTGVFTNITLFGPTSWSVSSLSVSNCSLTFAQDGFRLTVTNDLRIDSGGHLGFGAAESLGLGPGNGSNYALECGGNLILTNGGALSVVSGKTNGIGRDYGLLVSVTNDLLIASSSWVYVYSHEQDGGSPLFRARNLVVLSNGGFNATARGFAWGYGPGKGTDNIWGGGGAGHGGKGGLGYDAGSMGGVAYGASNAPICAGSAGGASFWDDTHPGGAGGGVIRVEAMNNITIDGTISAKGSAGVNASPNGPGGGGAGGSIYLSCGGTFGGGTSGILQADGNNSGIGGYGGGGGGGGRIAVWHHVPDWWRQQILAGSLRATLVSATGPFQGTVSVTNGTGYNNGPPNGAEVGSQLFGTLKPKGTIISGY